MSESQSINQNSKSFLQSKRKSSSISKESQAVSQVSANTRNSKKTNRSKFCRNKENTPRINLRSSKNLNLEEEEIKPEPIPCNINRTDCNTVTSHNDSYPVKREDSTTSNKTYDSIQDNKENYCEMTEKTNSDDYFENKEREESTVKTENIEYCYNSSNIIDNSIKTFQADNTILKDLDLKERDLIERSFLQKPILKVNCTFCEKDISSVLRIITVSMKEYCFDCLTNLLINEDYHIIDKLDFPIFNTNWILKEEYQLLSCIEKFGLDNWAEISSGLKSKPKLPCEAHFYNYYVQNTENPFPITDKIIIGQESATRFDIVINESMNKTNQDEEEEKRGFIISNKGSIPDFNSNKESKNIRSRSLVKNRNRKDQKNIYTAEEILGYWPKREEFDVEYLNEAELEIADLEFLEEDTQEEIDLKLNVLRVYNMHLEEREARKKFIIERELLDVKKQMNFERKLQRDDREIYICLKPFARFFSKEEFDELFNGLVLEKNLRQRLNQLLTFQELGLKTYEDVEKYLEVDSRRNKESKKKNIFYDSGSTALKLAKEIKSMNEDLSNTERDFVKKKNIPLPLYQDIKTQISKEARSSVKVNIMSKLDCSKEEAEEIANFVVKLKRA